MKKWVVRVRCQFSSLLQQLKKKGGEKKRKKEKRKEKIGPKTHHVFCL
jgi:hypothetical protein